MMNKTQKKNLLTQFIITTNNRGNPMSHTKLFPDVKLTETIPEGFVDVSYQHDESPSWFNEAKNMVLFISKTISGKNRYYLQQANSGQELVSSSDWNEVLQCINNYPISLTTIKVKTVRYEDTVEFFQNVLVQAKHDGSEWISIKAFEKLLNFKTEGK